MMNSKTFEGIVNDQMQRCKDVLLVKAAEYAPVDRLSNFRTGGALLNQDPARVIGDYMAKHVVSIYDMLQGSTTDFTMDVWLEKITDNMNYLLLLLAAVTEADKSEPEFDIHIEPTNT